jgi:hypothetical protein
MYNKPKDTFWGVVTIPFRLLGVILFSVIAIPLVICRKIWAPHLPAGIQVKLIYLFIRYGDYENDGEDY